MSKRAEELAAEYAGRPTFLTPDARTKLYRMLQEALEQYGQVVRDAAAKAADNPGGFDYDFGRQDAAKAIREMPLP